MSWARRFDLEPLTLGVFPRENNFLDDIAGPASVVFVHVERAWEVCWLANLESDDVYTEGYDYAEPANFNPKMRYTARNGARRGCRNYDHNLVSVGEGEVVARRQPLVAKKANEVAQEAISQGAEGRSPQGARAPSAEQALERLRVDGRGLTLAFDRGGVGQWSLAESRGFATDACWGVVGEPR